MNEKDIALIYAPEKIKLVCRNCNTEWTEIRPKGYYIRYEKGNNYLINRRNSKIIKYFKCPNCDAIRNIGRLSTGRKLL